MRSLRMRRSCMKFFEGHKRHLSADKTSTAAMEEGTAGENFLQAVWPMLVFVVVYQILLWLMEQALQYLNRMLQAGDAPAQVLAFQYAHTADYRALMAAVGMCLALLMVLRLCCRPGEIGFTRHMGTSWQQMFMAALAILCTAVAFNLLISQAVAGNFLEGSGALRQVTEQTAAGVESAKRQTGSVTLWIGIAVYGFLTPLAEESIFRGITLQRLYKAFLIQWDRNAGCDRSLQDNAHLETRREERRARLLAAVLSSLFFGMYHGNVAQGIYAACMGLAFCRLLEISENLGAVVLLHGAINVVVLLLERSGGWNGGYQGAFMAALLGVALCSAAAAHRCGKL